MKEFLLLIRTEGDQLAAMSAEQQQIHVQKIGNYIGNLMKEGKLKGAQPLEMDGKIIHGRKGVFKDGPFAESKKNYQNNNNNNSGSGCGGIYIR